MVAGWRTPHYCSTEHAAHIHQPHHSRCAHLRGVRAARSSRHYAHGGAVSGARAGRGLGRCCREDSSRGAAPLTIIAQRGEVVRW